MTAQSWRLCDRILQFQTKWFTLIGEHLQPSNGTVLEYWRIEKADSVIIIPIQNQQLILPSSTYRPGLGKTTLDFPGGRCPKSQPLEQAAVSILKRELGIAAATISQLTLLNQTGWAVNSSFSNQKLYGFVAQLQPEVVIPMKHVGVTYPATTKGIQLLLNEISCLQCRLVLREWQAEHMRHQLEFSAL